MFTEASNFVEGVDFAYKLIYGICFFFLISITAVMIFFVVRYSKKRHPQAKQVENNSGVEITWTVIPLILVLIMFYYGYIAFLPMRHAPKDALIVKTTGQMWAWDFEYPNGKHSPELIVPVNKAIKLDMNSKDVIHGMEIPEFRLKEDVIPGRQTMLWFIANHEGSYRIFCSFYCGVAHSGMLSMVRVLSQDKYNQWLLEIPKKVVSAEAGLKVLQQNTCTACHSLDGSKIVGPTFKGFYGSKHAVLTDGKEREITVDSTYIKNSILTPDMDVAKGFNKGLMRSYKSVVTDEDIKCVIEYFKSIK